MNFPSYCKQFGHHVYKESILKIQKNQNLICTKSGFWIITYGFKFNGDNPTWHPNAE